MNATTCVKLNVHQLNDVQLNVLRCLGGRRCGMRCLTAAALCRTSRPSSRWWRPPGPRAGTGELLLSLIYIVNQRIRIID